MKHILIAVLLLLPLTAGAEPRPNILWLTSEDHGPHLGCYGDKIATTPHLDALAARGQRFTFCWSNAPVCAPARTTLFSGLYPTSTGAEHMRSQTRLPADFGMFPQYLREAGYYCTNNVKEDYNLVKPGGVWDASSNKAHWKNRGEKQPFFAVFNSTLSHESQLRNKPGAPKHDPAAVRVPAYHPDRPEVRKEWAHYHDNITLVDAAAGKHLEELAAAGLTDDTIVFYFSDHGSGMPRNKRSACDSGLHVPLIVYFPEKWKSLAPRDYRTGGTTEQLVSFVDFAPTVLSLAGVKPPHWMQGVPFAGKFAGEPRKYVFGFRGRMDERYDLVRSVSDGRFVYVRNFMPHLPHGQHVEYMFETATTRVWKQLFDAGKLTPAQAAYWERKAPEELYDLKADPDEVVNLAAVESHRAKRDELRAALRKELLSIRDAGFLPEDEIHTRSEGSSPYELAHEEARYPLERILTTAERASSGSADDLPKLETTLGDQDSAVRRWAAIGFLVRDAATYKVHAAAVQKLLADPAPAVRIAAANVVAEFDEKNRSQGLETLVALANPEKNSPYVACQALNALDNLGAKAAAIRPELKKLPTTFAGEESRIGYKTQALLKYLLRGE